MFIVFIMEVGRIVAPAVARVIVKKVKLQKNATLIILVSLCQCRFPSVSISDVNCGFLISATIVLQTWTIPKMLTFQFGSVQVSNFIIFFE
jgi:hypothetical protein